MGTFVELIKEVMAEQAANFDVLVLKGFSNNVLQEVAATCPHALGELPLDAKGLLDLGRIQKSQKSLLTALTKAPATTKLLLDFESFMQIASHSDVSETGKRFLVIENNLLEEYPNQSNFTADDFEDAIHADKEIPDDSPFYNFYSNAIFYKDQTLVQYIDGFDEDFECVMSLKLFEPLTPEFLPTAPTDLKPEAMIHYEALGDEYRTMKLRLYQGKIPKTILVAVEDTIHQQKAAYQGLELFASALKALGCRATFYLHSSRLSLDFRPELTALLSQYWNSDGFRTLYVYKDPDAGTELMEVSQAAIIEEVICQYENGRNKKNLRDILLTAPTGAGKSLLFQLPAIYLADKYKAVTIVISPLIALMKDQVIALKTIRKYEHVAYVNSELSIIEREEVLQKVHNGEISILYLSPELLLSQELSVFLGNRELGLLVIDEAHLVTTWGRDFRTDYWYLGNFIRKARRYFNYKFPVLAVTATAVYSGPNDMVIETLDSLYLENPRLFIGKVKREDIDFDINDLPIERYHNKEKFTKTAARIQELINAGQKTIVYCPWVSQLIPIRDLVEYSFKDKIGLYFGGLNKLIKNETYEHFKSNQIKTILSTKAFGMGVDIDDITTIYHHAPSGHLADYVQEIGRVARRSDIRGVAMTDFNVQDLKFTRILYAFSAVRQFQLQLVLDKILKIYSVKNNKNLLVSVNDFQYIFKEEDVDIEQKVKSSFILLEKDLQAKYRYNVIIARPKSLFTAVYARVNEADVKKFSAKYGKASRYIPQPAIEAKGQKVYALNLDKIWKTNFSDQNFPQIKKAYFDKTLFQPDEIYVSPQIRVVFNLKYSSKEIYEMLDANFRIIEKALDQMGADFFTEEMLAKELESRFEHSLTAKRVAEIILSVFACPIDLKNKRDIFTKPECFIQEKKTDHELQYKAFPKVYPAVRGLLKKRYDRMFVELPQAERTAQFFIPANDDKNVGMIQLAYLLEAFDLATYVIGGGEKPGVFIRINDPVKLIRLAKSGYTNDILKEIERRQQTSLHIMEYFFTHILDTPQRWKFIEDYFLGTSSKDLTGSDFAELPEEGSTEITE
jgi:superfamily II DNA/RNA helicase